MSPTLPPRVAGPVVGLALAATLGGCTLHKGGFERDVVVRFSLPAGDFTPPAASVSAIERNCKPGNGIQMEPVPPANSLPSVRLNGIRFDVGSADDAQISALQTCLDKQPGVTSADLEDEDS